MKIVDEVDRFSRAFHFRAKLFLDLRKLLITEYRNFNCISFQLRREFKVLYFLLTQHHFSSKVYIWLVISLSDKGNSARSTRISFNDINLAIFYCELNI